MTIIYFILAAIALGILVFVHELGHYIAAKKTGMRVEVFSIGFGKPVFRWRWNDVDWQLGWLPFGGYVKIAGMEITKKDKNTYVEPSDVPEGFFAKPPYQRILVAIAGPVFNLVLALLAFTLLWAMGGRDKPFSDFTHIIGWIDPQSEIYALGVRPGDLLTAYDGNAYKNSKDLLYAAMLGDKKVKIDGFHVNYEKGERTPFSYTVSTYASPDSLSGILTTGITASGRYLIYEPLPGGAPNPLPDGSPMEPSGIQNGDRLVWADGELLFSMNQLSYILNNKQTFLTVQRGTTVFQTRQPRVLAGDLLISTNVRNELIDWQYEAGIRGRWQELYMLPYNLSADAVVEGPLTFIDEESKRAAYPIHSYSQRLEVPLQAGDRILAIDGVPINTAYQLIDLIQTHHIQLIVQRGGSYNQEQSWQVADKDFIQSLNVNEIDQIASSIGQENDVRQAGSYVLLHPVAPKRINQFVISKEAREKSITEYEEQLNKINQVRNPEKRTQMLNYLNQSQNRYLLGIYLQDRTVQYNPNPFTLFADIFKETWHTLKALFLGYLNPKWISGPVGIVQVLHHGWTLGFREALFWIGAISLNLGFVNLLPVPVVDGGYICMSLYEWITRRRIKAKTMERLIIPFVILLIALMIFLTFQDVLRLFIN